MTLAKSPWIIHVNCNSCNGCDIEVVACLTPLYDAERFGVLNIGTPKQADIMAVTVGKLKNMWMCFIEHLKPDTDQKFVLAVGACIHRRYFP